MGIPVLIAPDASVPAGGRICCRRSFRCSGFKFPVLISDMQRSAPLGQNRTHQNSLDFPAFLCCCSHLYAALGNGRRLHVYSAHAARQADIRLLHSSRTPLWFFLLIFPPRLHSFTSNPPLLFSSSAHSFCPSFCSPPKLRLFNRPSFQVSKSPRL